MKFSIRTYGCQMNERDSEAVASLLLRRGHEATPEAEADLVLVNTCSVRGKAEDKAIGKLGLVASGKRERPGLIVGVMGCMAQRLGVEVFKRVPALDFSIGTHRISSLPAVLDRLLAGEGPILEDGAEEDDAEALCGHPEGEMSAFVNILLGCNRRCAYCIVPAVRGAEWSRPINSVLSEVRSLTGHGVREVTLLGQSVMSYGRSNDVTVGAASSPGGFAEALPRLLEAVSALEGIRRVRFMSGHPSGVTPELVRAMATLPAVSPHLHLPVQSGSDRILKRMRRGYTADDYRAAIVRLRKALPDVALTTDVIVGFPSETEDEFEMTRALMEEVRVDNAYIFKYSPRPDTPAASWDDDVSDAEKMRRNQVLLADQEVRGVSINEGFVGKTVDVLVEGVSLRNETRWSGRSGGNKIVVFPPVSGVSPGDLCRVRIERAMAQTLYGQVAGNEEQE